MTLERGHARDLRLLTLDHRAVHGAHVPHLERLVEAATNQELAVGTERDRVDRVFVSPQLVEQDATRGVPDPYDRVEAARGEVLAVGRHDDRGHACVELTVVEPERDFVDRERVEARARVHVPNPSRLVARARDEPATVGRERERVDLRLVPLEHFSDALLGDVPNLRSWGLVTGDEAVGKRERGTDSDGAVFGSGREELAVRAEGRAADVVVRLDAS